MNDIQLNFGQINQFITNLQRNPRENAGGYVYDERNQPLGRREDNMEIRQEDEYDADMTVIGEREDIGDIIDIFTKTSMKTFMTDYILNIEVEHDQERVKLGYLIVTRLRDIIIEINKFLALAGKRYRLSIKGGSSIHNFFTHIKNNNIRNPGVLPEISVFLNSFISEGSYDKYSDFDTLLYFPSEIQVDEVDNITWLQNISDEIFTTYLTSEFKFLNNLLLVPDILLLFSNLLNSIKDKIRNVMPNRVIPLLNVISQANFDKLKNSMMNEELEKKEILEEYRRYKLNYSNKNNLFIHFTDTDELSDSFFNKYVIKINETNPYFIEHQDQMNIIKNSSISLSNMQIFSEKEITKEVLANFLLTRIMLSFEIHEYDANTGQSHNIVEMAKIMENPQLENRDNRIYVQNTRLFKDFKPVKYKAEILDISEDLDPKKAIKHTKLGITKEYYGKEDLNIYNTSFAGLVYDLLEFFSERKDKKLEKRCKRFSAFIVLYVILNLEISYILVETLKGVFMNNNTPYESPEGSDLERFGYYLFNKILFQFYNWVTYNFDNNFNARLFEITDTVNIIIRGQTEENKRQVIENVINIMYRYYERIDNDLKELGTYKILFKYQKFESIFYLSEILNESPSQFKENIVYTLGKCFEDKSFIFERNEPTKSLFRNFIRFYINMDYKTYRIANQNDPILNNPFINYELYRPGNNQVQAAFNIDHKKLISSNIEYFRNLADEIIEYSISELKCKIMNCENINYTKIFAGGYGFKQIIDTRNYPGSILFKLYRDDNNNNKYLKFIKRILDLFNDSILTSMDVDCFVVIDDTEIPGIDVLNEIKFSDTFNKFLFKSNELTVPEHEDWKILKNVNIQPEFLVNENSKMLTQNRCIYFVSDIFNIGHTELPPSKNKLRMNSLYGVVLSKRKGDATGQGGYCKKNFKNDVLNFAFLSKRDLTSFLRQYTLTEYIRLGKIFYILNEFLNIPSQINYDEHCRTCIKLRPESYNVLNNYMMELYMSSNAREVREAYNTFTQNYNVRLNIIEVYHESILTRINVKINVLKVLKNDIQKKEVDSRNKIDEGIIGRVKTRIIDLHRLEINEDVKNLYIQVYNYITGWFENDITLKTYIDEKLRLNIDMGNIEKANIDILTVENQEVGRFKNYINELVREFIRELTDVGINDDELLRNLNRLIGNFERPLEEYIKYIMEYLTLLNFRELIERIITQKEEEITNIKRNKDAAKQALKEDFHLIARGQIINNLLGGDIKGKYMANRDKLLTEEEKITTRVELEQNYINPEQLAQVNNVVQDIINSININNTQREKLEFLQRAGNMPIDISDYILNLSTYLVLNNIIDKTEYLYINAVILVQMNKKKLINEIRVVFYGILLFTSYFRAFTTLTLSELLYEVNQQILQKISNYNRAEHSHILGDIIFDFTLYQGININYDITDNYIDTIISERGFLRFKNRIEENLFVEHSDRFMDKRPCYYD